MNKLDNIRIVLSLTSHPGNIGSTARAMKTMGISELVLINPTKFPHPIATAMAAGADDVLSNARVCGSLEEALVGCSYAFGLTARRRELSHQPRTPREISSEIIQFATSEKVALVFGNETSGLSNADLILCQQLVHIPTSPESTSLNLAAAVQIMAYELHLATMSANETPTTDAPALMATHEEVEGFFKHLERMLIAVEFLDPLVPKRLMIRLRRLFGRTRLEKDEINILRGILTAILKE